MEIFDEAITFNSFLGDINYSSTDNEEFLMVGPINAETPAALNRDLRRLINVLPEVDSFQLINVLQQSGILSNIHHFELLRRIIPQLPLTRLNTLLEEPDRYYNFIRGLNENLWTDGLPESVIDSLPIIKVEQQECPICFELQTECTQLPCQHIFHKNCITRWLLLQKSCPVCRKNIEEV